MSNSKKICFALLVHNKRELVKQLIDNIRYFCPNSIIVLYNGGDDPNLVKNLGVMVCPTSKKIKYGNLSLYFLETMEWLNEIEMDYDYFINIDSDALFIKEGYEDFIDQQMSDCDFMAVSLRSPKKHWFVGRQFKKEIKRWEPFFCVDQFLGVFNVGQVLSKELVDSLINYEKKDLLQKALLQTNVFAIEEIVFANLAKELGFKVKSYPKETGSIIRFRPHFTSEEISHLLKSENKWLCHPVERNSNDPVRKLIVQIQNHS